MGHTAFTYIQKDVYIYIHIHTHYIHTYVFIHVYSYIHMNIYIYYYIIYIYYIIIYIYIIYNIYRMPHQESSSLPSGSQPWPSPASLEPPFSPFVKPTCRRNREDGPYGPTLRTENWWLNQIRSWKMVKDGGSTFLTWFKTSTLGQFTPHKLWTWWLNQRIDFRVPGEAGWRWPTVIESILIQWKPILGTFLQ